MDNSVTIDNITYELYDNNPNYASVINNTLSVVSSNVVIPNSFTYNNNTYTVTTIGVDAFANCSNLVSITIPDSVTTIGANAFANCSRLFNVVVIKQTNISVDTSSFTDVSSMYSCIKFYNTNSLDNLVGNWPTISSYYCSKTIIPGFFTELMDVSSNLVDVSSNLVDVSPQLDDYSQIE